MNKSKMTIKTFFVTVATTLACCMVLVGATFAWFTSTVTSSGNKIKAGRLEVDLLFTQEDKADITNPIADMTNLRDNAQPLFSLDNWQPGATITYVFAAVNNGTIPLSYDLYFQNMSDLFRYTYQNENDEYLTKDGTYVTDSKKAVILTLADVIDVYIDGEYYAPLASFTGGESLMNGTLAAKTGSDPTVSPLVEVTLEFWKGAGNEYQGVNLLNSDGEFDIQLFATQTNAGYQPTLPTKQAYNRKMVQRVNKVSTSPETAPDVRIDTGATAISISQNSVNDILTKVSETTMLEFVTEITEDKSGSFDISNGAEDILKIDCTLNAISNGVAKPVEDFFEPVTVTIYIAKGINGSITISCKNAPHCPDNDHNPQYNSSTGKLTFTTSHFSQFVVRVEESYDFAYTLLADDTYMIGKGNTAVSNGSVVDIPAEYQGLPVSTIADGGFKNSVQLQTINIPSSITRIGKYAFDGCTQLTNVTIPTNP